MTKSYVNSKRVAIILILLGVLTFNGISLIINLITLIYPLFIIRGLLNNNFYNKVINNKRKRVTEDEINFLKESIFWLKYLCLISLLTTIENLVYFVPFSSKFINIIKLIVFFYSIIRHYFLHNKSRLEIYDQINLYFGANLNKFITLHNYMENTNLIRDFITSLNTFK